MTRVTGLTGLGDLLPHRRADAERFAALVDGRRVNGGLADHPDLADLARLAAALAPADHRPDPAFRTALRERLVAEAASRPVADARAADPAGVAAETATPTTTPRWRTAVATVAVAAVVSGAGAAAASYRALPGDALYGLKRQIESVELALANGDLDRGRELLEQAETRLGEAERLAASSEISEPGTRADLVATLADMREATEEGSLALTDAYRETGDAEPLRILRDFADEQQERLRDLMAMLDPGLRDTVRPLLADLVSLERTASILLGTTAAADAADLGEASGDGWAVSMLLDRTSGTTGDAGSTLADGTGSAGALTGSGSGDGGLVGGLVHGVTGALDGGSESGSGGGSAGTSGGTLGGSVDDGVDGVGDTVDGVADGVDGVLDPVTSPLVSSTPLPTSTPLPSLDPTTVSSPLPTVSVCVTLLGVETC